MATPFFVLRKCQIFKSNSYISSVPAQYRYSQYPSFYIKPVHKRDVQEELYDSGKAQQFVHVPTRAALNNQTCSPLQDDLISLFINYVMKDGRKALARELVEKAFEKIKRVQLEKYHKAKTEEGKAAIELNPRTIFHKAVDHCKPIMNLTPIRRGGVTYQVPVPITEKQSQFRSMKWIIEAANEKERTIHFPEKLAYELIDAADNTGRVVKRKQDIHKQCEANRAYAHYRWT